MTLGTRSAADRPSIIQGSPKSREARMSSSSHPVRVLIDTFPPSPNLALRCASREAVWAAGIDLNARALQAKLRRRSPWHRWHEARRSSTVEHGTRRVKDRMPGIGNTINDHLYRQSEKELVQEIFYSTGAEFGSRNLQRSLAVQFAMRFTHPFARLVAIIPDVFRCSKNPS